MARRQVQAALGALWWAVSGCSGEPSPDAAQPKKPALPAYDLARPLGALPEPSARDDAFRRGASLGMFVCSEDDTVRKPLYTKALDELVELGATDVQLRVEWTQTDASAIEISPSSTRTVDDELLRWVIDEANQRSLRVFLMPVLDVAGLGTEGGLQPYRANLSPPDWDRWWWSYRRFVIHYAQIAAGHKAAMLSVGSELTSTEQQTERWQDLIKVVRKVYHGPLTYSASAESFEAVSFWDDLDVVGVSAHQPLVGAERAGSSVASSAQAGSAPAAVSDAELERGLTGFTTRLAKWALARNKRYLLTEVGFPAQAHAALRPWDLQTASPADPLLQLRCYRALYRAFQGDPRLLGLYDRWFDDADANNALHSPRGKPAQEVLRHWFKRSRAAETATAVTN